MAQEPPKKKKKIGLRQITREIQAKERKRLLDERAKREANRKPMAEVVDVDSAFADLDNEYRSGKRKRPATSSFTRPLAKIATHGILRLLGQKTK
jgi:hypothetical protein